MLLFWWGFSSLVIVATQFVMWGTILFICFLSTHKPPKEPVQELKILVDLPSGAEINAVPLLLNSVDAALFSYLMRKCTRTIDQGKILLHYKRRGEIYSPKHNTFQIKGALYKPTQLKVIYCSA